MRDLTEATCSRVLWFGIFTLIMLVGTRCGRGGRRVYGVGSLNTKQSTLIPKPFTLIMLVGTR